MLIIERVTHVKVLLPCSISTWDIQLNHCRLQLQDERMAGHLLADQCFLCSLRDLTSCESLNCCYLEKDLKMQNQFGSNAMAADSRIAINSSISHYQWGEAIAAAYQSS